MVFILVNAVVFAQQYTLTVNITGISDNKGDIYIYLYTSEKGFPIEISKANKVKKVTVSKKSLSVSFKDIAYGTYAVSVYHDIDANGKNKESTF